MYKGAKGVQKVSVHSKIVYTGVHWTIVFIVSALFQYKGRLYSYGAAIIKIRLSQ